MCDAYTIPFKNSFSVQNDLTQGFTQIICMDMGLHEDVLILLLSGYCAPQVVIMQHNWKVCILQRI